VTFKVDQNRNLAQASDIAMLHDMYPQKALL
jgi:hypothetical protein